MLRPKNSGRTWFIPGLLLLWLLTCSTKNDFNHLWHFSVKNTYTKQIYILFLDKYIKHVKSYNWPEAVAQNILRHILSSSYVLCLCHFHKDFSATEITATRNVNKTSQKSQENCFVYFPKWPHVVECLRYCKFNIRNSYNAIHVYMCKYFLFTILLHSQCLSDLVGS